MNQKKIPGHEIVKNKVEKVDSRIEIEAVKEDFDTETYLFHLGKDGKKCEVALSRDLLDDLRDCNAPKGSHYWQSLERELTYKIITSMQFSGFIPFSSDIFFEDNQDWEEKGVASIPFCCSANGYEIFQRGLKKLYDHLLFLKCDTGHLNIAFPYEEDMQRIGRMIAYREDEINKEGSDAQFKDSISLCSRRHLKAALLIEFVGLEDELKKEYPKAFNDGITQKVKEIFGFLTSDVFEKVRIPEYLEGIKPTPVKVVPKSTNCKVYDVVLSFAGEDRKHAEKLASLLKSGGFKVFYDKYEEATLWGKDLYEHLSEVYSKHGKYCVMFLSVYYAKKQWTTHERKSAQERAFNENKEYILPIRIDNTEIPGIHGTIGYLDLREKTIEEIYNILRGKLSE